MKRNNAKKIWVLICSGLLLLGSYSCLEISNTYSMVAPGVWRGLLDLRDQATIPPHPEHTDIHTKFDFSRTPSGVLPFNFEVTYPSTDSMQIFLINGEQRMAVSSYKYEPMVKGETGIITLYFPNYNTHIEAKVEAGVMEGNWYVDFKQNYSVPFKAYLGQEFRFSDTPDAASTDISGKWTMSFNDDVQEVLPAIGELQQDGNDLLGTIGVETGDSPNATGNISGNNIYMSSFNGLHAYLYEGKIISQDSILGAFYSGNHFRTTWEGSRN